MTKRHVVVLSCFSFLAAGTAVAAQVPAGTQMLIRLTSAVSSNKPGKTKVTAVLTTPVVVNGAVMIGAGAELTGDTGDVASFKAAEGTTAESPATVRLNFTQMGGKKMSATVMDVDNARETVDSSGLIVGIRESDTFGAQIDRGVKKLESKYGALGSVVGAVRDSMVKPVDPSIDFPAGVDLEIKLTQPLDWTQAATEQKIGPIQPADQLVTTVVAQPFRTAAEKPPSPSDLTNLMFLGTEEQVKAAFAKAGWFAADALSQSSKMETARAIIEDRGYKEAPVSVLTLDGKPPDLAMQKQTDTFAKRHHIRIFKRPDLFQGKPMWVASATHDTSIAYSKTSKSFSHGIDPNIDGERSKVTNDMLFTGLVHGMSLVDRPNIPKDATNATGDKLITDGKMVVLEF